MLTQTNKKESLLRDLLSKPLSEPGAMEPDVTESEAGEEQLAIPDDIDAPGTDGFNNLDLKDWSKDISLRLRHVNRLPTPDARARVCRRHRCQRATE